MKRTISIFGLGKLGVPLVACLIAKDFEVIGVDLDLKKVESLKQLKSPVYEPEVQEMLNKHGRKLTVTLDGIEAVKNSDVTFVVVATPSNPGGDFSNKFVLAACNVIGQALKEKTRYHLVSITSTVMPGSMENVIKPALEKISGKKAAKDFGLCYNPEFIALGSVVKDFYNPDIVLIGESDPKAGELLAGMYPLICDNKPYIARMNFVNAELTKISINTFVTTKISFANMLARICEKLPGADVDVVTSALGQDSRIGTKYLKGAISYGGPCFPRDNIALSTLAEQIGARSDIAKATDIFNRLQINLLADKVQKHLPKSGQVGVLGLTYKVDSDVIEEAAGFLLTKELVNRKVNVTAYDPLGIPPSKVILGDKVNFVESAEKCIELADVVVLSTPWKEFCGVPGSKWTRDNLPRVVIDCWGIVNHLKSNKDINYIQLGVGT
jgi:UDPglucose 6-dehydrogenase